MKTIGQRVVAVLAHDGIPERGRVKYLAKTCGFSTSTARRLLGDLAELKTQTLIRLSDGLQVSFEWLWDGRLTRFDLRTLRAHLIGLKGYPPEAAALMIRFMTACSTGHHRAENLLARIESGQLTLATAARLYAHATRG